MVEELFRQDAYLKDADATVTAVEERGVRLDRTIFYPTGGGQPGDSGVLRWDGGEAKIVDAVKADGGDVLHVLAPDAPRPAVGAKVQAVLDWDRRYRHMRMHTALHVMSAVIKGNVTGGQVNADKSRLDFNLEGDVPTKEWVTEEINKILAVDRPVTPQWVTDEELNARPELVKTMSVRRRWARAACGCWRSRASTCRPAAARTWRAPARSAASSAPRSRTRGR